MGVAGAPSTGPAGACPVTSEPSCADAATGRVYARVGAATPWAVGRRTAYNRRESASAPRPPAAIATPTAATTSVTAVAPAVIGSTPSVAPAGVSDSTNAVANASSA